MKINEKISHLRIQSKMSQEEFANKLDVSRQAVSKWESGTSIPQADKVVAICNLFNLTTDQLLRDELVINKAPIINDKNIKNKYFGTDGFRGEANIDLTSMHAYKIGRFLGWYYQQPSIKKDSLSERPRIVIGKDTRRSSYMLEYALASGIASSGGDAYILHVTTSPSVAYITRNDDFECGVMITASHNPFYDNGIKIINNNGEKFDDYASHLIECYIDGNYEELGLNDDIPLAKRDKVGSIIDYYAGRNRYIGHLISLGTTSYKNLRIGIDTANGASWSIARTVFEALGAKIYLIGNEPNGINTNLKVGSTHIEKLVELVKEKNLDVGFAFDGDADRCIAVDEHGNVVDGDKIMYILAKSLKSKGYLNSNTVVTTIMSNSGLKKSLAKIGITNIQTNVGDRFVYEEMMKNNYSLGGEQSGHIIIKKYATTGDGILTAIMITEEIVASKQSLSILAEPVKLFPQILKNVRVTSKEAVMQDQEVISKCKEITEEIGDNGRILLRKSGTEPVIRIMVEAENDELCNQYIERMYKTIEKRGFVCE